MINNFKGYKGYMVRGRLHYCASRSVLISNGSMALTGREDFSISVKPECRALPTSISLPGLKKRKIRNYCAHGDIAEAQQ